MREIIQPQEDDQQIIEQLYPNPDNMTYEQLLELQDKIGFVNKGLNDEQIKVNLFFKY